MEDAFKKADRLGYARGYAAGKKRRKREQSEENRRAEELAFRDRVFLAALPVCITQGIMSDDGKLNDHIRKIAAAWWYAGEAVNQRRRA